MYSRPTSVELRRITYDCKEKSFDTNTSSFNVSKSLVGKSERIAYDQKKDSINLKTTIFTKEENKLFSDN